MMWSKKPEKIIDNSALENLNLIVGTNTINIGTLRSKLDSLDSEFSSYRVDMNERLRKLNILLSEKLDSQKEDNETLLIGLEKSFSQKISNLNNGKPIITDLLRQVAVLEAVKDAAEHRLSSAVILNKIKELNDLVLQGDLNDKDTREDKARLDILKWAIGDNT